MRNDKKGPFTIYDPSPAQIQLAEKFVNVLMGQGKKAAAQRCFENALKQVGERLPKCDPLDVFVQTFDFVGRYISDKDTIRYIISRAEARAGKAMYLRLADEILANYRLAISSRLAGRPN